MTTAKDRFVSGIRSELEAIRALSNDGSLNPAVVLEWARSNPQSELFKTFEWDDAKAAHDYRLDQARRLIQRFEVSMPRREQEPTEVRLVSVPKLRTRDDKGGSYLPVPVVQNDEDLRANVEQETLLRLQTMRRNYRDLCPNLEPVWAAIEQVSTTFDKEEDAEDAA
jgi:hypothetical protein